MDKIVKIGFPMEYEDDEHIIRTGMWLKEYEVEMLEKKLNEYNHLQSKIDKATKKADELRKYIYRELVDFNVCGSTEAHCLAKDLLDILKEVE